MVTNDTGPMHVAAALGKPIAAIFGPMEPRRTGPYGQIDRALRVELPCAACLKAHCTNLKRTECLIAATSETVFAQIEARLGAIAER